MIKKPKAVLFDWDNTLANTWPTIQYALEKTFIEMGETPWTMEETKVRVHRSLRDSFPEIFGDRWEEAGERYLQHFRAVHLERLQPLEDAQEMLEKLQQTGVYMSVVSNKTGISLRAEAEHIGWDKYFTKIIGAKDADEDKPSIKPVLLALEDSGIEMGGDVWFIGDSITDMHCAYNAGCVPVFYGDQDLTSEAYANHQPKHHVNNHKELIDLISQFEI